jgi:hypothetical protein
MPSAQTIKHVGFTLPSPMEEEFDRIAAEEHRTKSELFREMFRVYRSYRKRRPEPEIDDEWVMQVIREAQKEQKQNPMTPEELVAEFRELSRYGSQQAKKVGINEEDIDTILRERRNKTTKGGKSSSP